MHDPAFDLIEFGRHGIDLHAESGCRFVNQIDRLVGQESIGDVAMREDSGSHKRRVLELHAMMNFVALAQTAQDADRVFHRGLVHHHRLESSFERRVFFDVLAIFVESGGANRMQFAPGEHGLEHVRRVDRSFSRAGTHDGVKLVDEQNNLAL